MEPLGPRGLPLIAPRVCPQCPGHELVCAALATLVFAMLPEEYPILQAVDTLEAAGLAGIHRWGLILPNSSPKSYPKHFQRRYQVLVSIGWNIMVSTYPGRFTMFYPNSRQVSHRNVLRQA